MGYIPCIPPPVPRQTRLERLKELYVRGRIDVEALEWYAGLMFENRVAGEPYLPAPGGLPPAHATPFNAPPLQDVR